MLENNTNFKNANLSIISAISLNNGQKLLHLQSICSKKHSTVSFRVNS